MQKVLITGGTGLIGSRLSYLLHSRGYEVRLLSRSENSKSKFKSFVWDIDNGYINENAFEDLDYIIHLAGAGIADKKWTEQRKEIIINSRVKSTNLLLHYIRKLEVPLKAFISSSAVGYYGSVSSEIIFTEDDNPGQDFLAEVCIKWEDAIFQFESEQIRTAALRTGIVLSSKGGALSKMKTPIISPLGNGLQYMPWIHIDDLCELYIKLIEDSKLAGVFNGVAPEHHTNKSFSKKLAQVFNRPFLPLGAPGFLLKLIFGEMATLLLNGSRVSANKVQQTEFQYKFPSLQKALEAIRKSEKS